MSSPPVPGHDASPSPRKPARRARRWLPRIALTLLALLALAGALLFAAVKTEGGARLLWQAAGRALSGRLAGEVAGGTLADGLRLRDVVYRDAAREVRIDRLDARWSWSHSPLKLTVGHLRIGTLDLTQYPTPKQPPSEPRSLALPLAVELRDATLQKLALHSAGATSLYTAIALHGRSDGTHHALTLEHADTPYGAAQADLRLGGARPFPLDGGARLQGRWRDEGYRLDAKLSGSLEALGVQLTAQGDRLHGDANIEAALFSDVVLRRARIALRNLNPQLFSPGAPRAALDVDANLMPEGDAAQLVLSGPVSLRNAQPGPLDQELLPVIAASAQVRLGAQRQQVRQLQAQLPGGATLTGGGELHGGAGGFALQADKLDLHALHGKLQHTRLGGPLTVDIAGDTQHLVLDLSGAELAIAADAQIDARRLALTQAELRAGSARLLLSGTLARDGRRGFAMHGTLTGFNPARFLAPPAPDARINMDFDAQGALQPRLQADVAYAIRDSRYAGLPMTGNGRLQVDGPRVAASDARLAVAGNRLRLDGSFGAPGERLRFEIDAPALARLGFGLSGLLRAHGEAGGSVERPTLDADFNASGLSFHQYRLAQASGAVHGNGVPGRDPDARVTLALDARGAQAPDLALTTLHAALEGSTASHDLSLTADGRLRGRPLALTVAAHGRLQQAAPGYAWDGTVGTLENRGFPRLALEQPLALSVAPGRLVLGAARLRLEQAQLALASLRVDEHTISSAGSVGALDIGHLLELRRTLTGAAPPVKTDLVLDGSWDFSLADSARGYFQLERRGGDVRMPGELRDTALGITTLRLRGDLRERLLQLSAHAAARRIGSADAGGQLALRPIGGRLLPAPDSALDARVSAAIPRLQPITALAGPGVALDGAVDIVLMLSGTLDAPVVTGDVAGRDLALMLYDQGVRLHDGSAQIHIADNVADIRELMFHGGDGTLRLTGQVPLTHYRDLSATIVADRLQLLADPSRQATVSGRAEAGGAGGQLQIGGGFTVDHGRFSLPEQSAPALGDDVTVVRGTREQARAQPQNVRLRTAKPAGPLSPRVQLQLDLGDDFYFRGSGADLQLAGALTVTSAPGEPARATGTVRIVGGTYEAFGAKLDIERGVLNFQGPFGNPNIDILAMRRGQEVAAGVHVTGTVSQPRVQLVSEPDVPEQEKLNWLVFGRGGGTSTEAGSGQAQAAAREAALGLLNKVGGARIAKGFGLDQLSIGSSEFGLGAQQVVSLGKEISNRLMVGYEQSLAGAEGVLKLTYELSRHWSVVVRGGTIGGVDVYYSKRFDHFGGAGEPR
ncbi:MAG TPA: translocation/assembly module TamB domain-containing protein [Noviherbaspirillum sp.]|nr:translocation/assembly module TamB domain-containing protein [Noviherbaspirillum sp.]